MVAFDAATGAHAEHPRDRASIDPESVLSGRLKPSITELLDLIHRVNPTGRELGARETAARYAQKSRLQSALVRRFGAEIEVVPDAHDEGTVLLRHRGQVRDGCHAVVAELDEDARAWVRLQVDLGPPASEPAAPMNVRVSAEAGEEGPPSSTDATPASLVRRAGEAIDTYDYDRARVELERAVAASGGAAGPAAALLALLVETLGDDHEALAREASLSREALADPEVRGLLAIAAARARDEERALALLRGTGDRRAAEAFAALASGALSAGDPERAAGHLDQLRRRAPTHAGIAGLTSEIARARAAARGPMEAEVLALAAAGRDGEAEEKAAVVIGRWPESEAARRVLRAADERRRRVEARRLVAEAEALLAGGDAEGALAGLARAAGAAPGPDREAIERRAREIDAGLRQRREAAQVDRVRRLLLGPDPGEGLLAYLELGDALRSGVRAAELGEAGDLVQWIDLVTRGAPRARVEAVIALARARAIVAADPEGARAALAPHAGGLDRVPEARRITREADSRIADRRAARAMEGLRAARETLAGGRAAEALGRLDEATLRDLPPEERASASALAAEAGRIVGAARRAAEVSRLRDAGRLVEARDLAEELSAEAEGEARARWEAERGSLQQAIQRAFHVEVDEVAAPLDIDGGPFPMLHFWNPVRWLTADGSAFVLAEGNGRSVLVRVVDREGLVVRTTVSLRTPEPIDRLWVSVVGRTLWLLGLRGALLVLSMDTWDVLRFRASPAPLPLTTNQLTTPPVLPVGDAPTGLSVPRFLWSIGESASGSGETWRAIDLHNRRPPREIPTAARVLPLTGAPEPRVVCCVSEAIVLLDDRGTAVAEGRFALPGMKPRGAALRPDGRGLVALVEIAAPGPTLAWVDVPYEGVPGAPQAIAGFDSRNGEACICTALDAGVVVVAFRGLDGACELMALGPDRSTGARALGVVWRVRNPTQRMMLMEDARARLLFGLEPRPEGTLLVELGRSPPELPAWICEGAKQVGAMHFEVCLRISGTMREAQASGVPIKVATAGAMVRHFLRDKAKEPLQLVLLMLMLEALGPAVTPEVERVLAWLVQNHPDYPDVRVLRAERLGRNGQWQEAADMIAPLADASTGGSEICPWHGHHLMAHACLHLGDAGRARATLARAKPEETGCPIVALRELFAEMPAPPPPEAWGPGLPLLTRIVGAARYADARLADGDTAAVVAALDRDPFSTCGEPQLLARLAAAWLPTPAPDRSTRLRKITMLSRFVESHVERAPVRRRELMLPGATWAEPRLDALVAEARAFLDGEG